MEIVINKAKTPIKLATWVRKSFEALSVDYTTVNFRQNDLFVEMVKHDGNKLCVGLTDLVVVEIPEEATDWMLINFGESYEEIYYIVDGKIFIA